VGKNIMNSIFDGVKAVAPMVANVVLPGSGNLVHTLMRGVAGAGPDVEIEEVAKRFEQDPTLMVELQRVAVDKEIELGRQAVESLQIVNQTMQVEAKSEHFGQRSWRPFNGYMFGITMFCVYFLLPALKQPAPEIPQFVWVAWASVLGVTTWHRGKEKRVKAGESGEGMLKGLIKAIKK